MKRCNLLLLILVLALAACATVQAPLVLAGDASGAVSSQRKGMRTAR